MTPQPLHNIEWVDPNTLRSNDYNPNHVAPTELLLLKISILQSGWTQPIVATRDNEIVDGFHRWTLGKTDKEIRALSNDLVPVVRADISTRSEQMAATVRHNRARGVHSITKMSDIVQQMSKDRDGDDICHMLGMEAEEIERLGDIRGMTVRGAAAEFSKGWEPDGD